MRIQLQALIVDLGGTVAIGAVVTDAEFLVLAIALADIEVGAALTARGERRGQLGGRLVAGPLQDQIDRAAYGIVRRLAVEQAVEPLDHFDPLDGIEHVEVMIADQAEIAVEADAGIAEQEAADHRLFAADVAR